MKNHDQSEYTAISALLTPFLPEVHVCLSTSGLSHPGVGLTAEHMRTVQKHVRREAEPWRTYFEDMLASESADPNPRIHLTDPAKIRFDSRGTNSSFIRDGLTAYTQAILYLVTGNSVYRKNALRILRNWSFLNPAEFANFPDAHIHVGIPMNRMCMAAEIIRYTSFPEGDSDLIWHGEEIRRFEENLLKPALKTFLSGCSGFMNQHLYTVIGAMSAYLFLDDTGGYAKTVEWFTVNKNAENPGFNGSIRRLFRKITTIDEVGQPEGSGIPLDQPVIQHVEMGRDQAHGCGDLTNAAILSRMMLAQGTKVDPVTGTVSDAENAVGIYEFDDDRILSAADFFFRYMLGYDSQWVQVPFSIRNGVIADNYTDFSPYYRGRYRTINFWDLYVYYTYCRSDVNLTAEYPYFTEGFRKKVPSVYYSAGKCVVNWDNVDGGGDFWLFLPEMAENDENLLAKKQNPYRSEAEDRGVMVKNRAYISVREENGQGFVRFEKSEHESVLAMTDAGTDSTYAAFRIRTDGTAKLTVNGGKCTCLLPDTCGEWKYVTCPNPGGTVFGDFYTLTVSEIAGSYTDLDCVEIRPEEETERHRAIADLRFDRTEYRLIACCGMPFGMKLHADCKNPVHYCWGSLPEGAAAGGTDGVLMWIPETQGEHILTVTAMSGETAALCRIAVTVCCDRSDALNCAEERVEHGIPYTRETGERYRTALEAARKAIVTASDEEFSRLLEELCRASDELEPLSPMLIDDPLTDGTSLDYSRMVYDSTMAEELPNLIDPEGTFCGYYKAQDRMHIMDFGEKYRIAVTKFGFRARLGFSDRLAGLQVFGSNDGEYWICLTEKEAAFTQYYQEVNVRNEEARNRYRYLKLTKTTEYPDALRGSIHRLLEFGVLRIWGMRCENE